MSNKCGNCSELIVDNEYGYDGTNRVHLHCPGKGKVVTDKWVRVSWIEKHYSMHKVDDRIHHNNEIVDAACRAVEAACLFDGSRPDLVVDSITFTIEER